MRDPAPPPALQPRCSFGKAAWWWGSVSRGKAWPFARRLSSGLPRLVEGARMHPLSLLLRRSWRECCGPAASPPRRPGACSAAAGAALAVLALSTSVAAAEGADTQSTTGSVEAWEWLRATTDVVEAEECCACGGAMHAPQLMLLLSCAPTAAVAGTLPEAETACLLAASTPSTGPACPFFGAAARPVGCWCPASPPAPPSAALPASCAAAALPVLPPMAVGAAAFLTAAAFVAPALCSLAAAPFPLRFLPDRRSLLLPSPPPP